MTHIVHDDFAGATGLHRALAQSVDRLRVSRISDTRHRAQWAPTPRAVQPILAYPPGRPLHDGPISLGSFTAARLSGYGRISDCPDSAQATLKRPADGSRSTARARRSKATAAPAPNKAHSHRAKVGSNMRSPQLQNDAPPVHTQLGTDMRRAVQIPIPTPTGTDAKRRMVAATRLMS